MRIIGPPGTGKTTYLQNKVEELNQFYSKEEFCLTSFTKSAAKVLSLRIGNMEGIGTLHSLCYQNVGRPEIADTKIKEWNESHPEYEMSNQTKKTIDDMSLEDTLMTKSDAMYSSIQIRRARMQPVNEWPAEEKRFFDTWYQWKYDNDLWDFTDMIEHNLSAFECAPNNPRVFFVDEAQDLTSLEVMLVKKWAQQADVFFVAGDSDQCLYSFKGASPHDFVGIDDDVHVLSQSYRVPYKVHEYASKLIHRIKNREAVEYNPKDDPGFVNRCDLNYKSDRKLIQSIQADIDNGYSVMLLASCSYMIDNVRDTLRRNFMPFHNPYRRRRGDWNPIRPGGTVDDLSLFANSDRSSFLQWQKHLKRSVFKSGIKNELTKLEKDKNALPYIWDNFVKDELKQNLGNIDWYVENCLATKKKSLKYPLRVLKKHGTVEPRIIIGTIHSVKGGEADIVYLFPDLSRNAYANLDDSVHRAFYVAATRARVGLKICKPFTGLFYEV